MSQDYPLKVEVENGGNSATVLFYNEGNVTGTGPNSCGHFCQTFRKVCCICEIGSFKCRLCAKL